MLIKLNEGEGLTIKANHSDESNSYVVSNINGKYLRMREFPSGDIPPKLEQGDSKNSSQAVQQTQPEVSLRDEIYNIVRKNVDSANRCWVITDDVMEKIAKQQAGA